MTRHLIDFGSARVQSVPLYSQLSNVFRELITQEEWPAGKALPSEAELSRKFGVSVGTTRKALETLETSGWVTRKQGRGTFVADPSERQFDKFCRILLRGTQKSVFAECTSKVMGCSLRLATREEARELEMGEQERVFVLQRILQRNGVPFIFERQTLRESLCPKFDELGDLPINLFKVLVQTYGIVVDRCEEHVRALSAPPDICSELGLSDSISVLNTKLKVVDIEKRNVALVDRWFETTDVDYSITLI